MMNSTRCNGRSWRGPTGATSFEEAEDCAKSAGPVPGAASEALRVIYYWHVRGSTILFLFAYPKSEQEDLSPTQLKTLKSIIETEYP